MSLARTHDTRWSIVSLVVAAGFAFGCAGSNVYSTQNASNERIPQPGVLLVYDFAVSPNDVVADTLGNEFRSEASRQSKATGTAYETAASLSEQLVEKLNERGITAERASNDRRPPLNAIVIKGQFLTIDKGSRTARMVIGFGVGSTELRVRGQAYQAREGGLRRLAAAEIDSHGSRTPGMAVPVAGGAIAGAAATSAIISGGMNIVRETRGVMHDDAGRIADEIAKRCESFYKTQGWL